MNQSRTYARTRAKGTINNKIIQSAGDNRAEAKGQMKEQRKYEGVPEYVPAPEAKHYRVAITEAEANAFFEITPSSLRL